LIARSTVQALRAGVLGQVRGGVDRLVQGIRQELGGDTRVVATGGEAEWVASGLDLFDTIVPELTLEGLAIAAETGART
jgi:type III pantothenate kinase